ncbi:MAG: sigma-70 family RNA polymerase sigma factor [Phycisphaerae bacterium]|nr:sigma-70 family RNA polymerase sigma factor [Phycisphaerae bacterium]
MNVELIRRMAAGDALALETSIDEFGGLVWSLALRFCRNRADAEDVVQQVFLDLWRGAGSYREELSSPETFVATIARRRLIDWRRSRQRRGAPVSLEAAFDVAAPDAEQAWASSDEVRRAIGLMQGLRAEHRRVLELSLRDGLSYPEIAEMLGVPLGTVKSHARRGMMELRAAMVGGAA